MWSAEEGYPGDPWYRDFYRDIGFDLDFEYIRPFILDGHTRVFTGFKYYRITGYTDRRRRMSRPRRASGRTRTRPTSCADRWIWSSAASRHMDRPPMITALFDAELFGHWWFEGPQWLDLLIRKLVYDQQTVELATPSDYLARHGTPQQALPSASSWGENGYSEFWLNRGNDWIHRHLHSAAGRMQAIARAHSSAREGFGEARARIRRRARCCWRKHPTGRSS